MGTTGWIPSAAVTNYHRLDGLNNRNLFSRSSGGQKSEIKVLAGPCFFQNLFGRILPHFFQAGGSWGSLGCGSITPIVASSFFWPSSLFFSVYPPSPFLSLIRIVVIKFRVYPNPEQSFFEALVLIMSIKIWSPSEVPDDLSFVAGGGWEDSLVNCMWYSRLGFGFSATF